MDGGELLSHRYGITEDDAVGTTYRRKLKRVAKRLRGTRIFA